MRDYVEGKGWVGMKGGKHIDTRPTEAAAADAGPRQPGAPQSCRVPLVDSTLCLQVKGHSGPHDAALKGPDQKPILPVEVGHGLTSSQRHYPMREICDDCGHEFGIWFVANPLWNRVIPGRVGMLCPCCFIVRAEKAGIECTGWELVPENLDCVGKPPVPQEAAPRIEDLELVECVDAECEPVQHSHMRWKAGTGPKATAPDWAMRVAERIIGFYMDGTSPEKPFNAENVAALIRQAGSDEITKLRADYDREHKWLNDAASEANSDLDSVASVIRKLREAGSERERELTKALNSLKCEVVGWLGLARPMLVQELSVTNVRVMEHHVAEASRLLGGESK